MEELRANVTSDNLDGTFNNGEIVDSESNQSSNIPNYNSRKELHTDEPSVLVDINSEHGICSEELDFLNDKEVIGYESNVCNHCQDDCSKMNLKCEFSTARSFVTLDLLPYEIILHITSFLDSKFLIYTLSKVCSTFSNLFNDSSFWRSRIRRRWPKEYPALPLKDPEEFDWKEACKERENEFQRWSDVTSRMDYFTFNHGLYGAVDTVHLNGTLLAVGSRDRYLNILDVAKLDENDEESSVSCRIFCKENAHDGWIWSIASCDKTLSTGSWDTRIKFWDLTTMTQTQVEKAHSAILCSHFESNLYVAGGYDRNVYHYDPRSTGIQCKKRYHGKPILCLVANDNYIMTGSEDSTVALYDRRAGAVIKKQKLAQYPMSMSYDDGQLWVGDRGGSVHLLDTSAGNLKLVKTYSLGHAQKVTGIIHTPGVLITCSTDRTVKVFEPNLDPELIANLTEITSEVAEISYQNGVLACASSGMSVGIYKPKEEE